MTTKYLNEKKVQHEPVLSKHLSLQPLFCSSLRFLIVLGFNDTSTLVGHFVSSPRKGRRDRKDGRGDEREGQGRKRNRNESDETEEIKIFSPLPLPATRVAGLAQL